MNSLHCPRCHYTGIIKFGKVRGRQRYRCQKCGVTWVNHAQNQRLERRIWNEYARSGMSTEKLAKKYSYSKNTIRKFLQNHPLPQLHPSGPAKVIVMDVTYFGRKWGILLVLNAISGEPLYCQKIIGYEKVMDYWTAIYKPSNIGIIPEACVIDGKPGVRKMLLECGFLVQVCQFHQIQTIIQNTTRKPELEPNQELLKLARLLSRASSEEFALAIASWQLNIWALGRRENIFVR